MNIIQAIRDPNVFAPFFRGSTWDTWLVFLAVLFGLPLTSEQLAIYQRFTGRTTLPAHHSLKPGSAAVAARVKATSSL